MHDNNYHLYANPATELCSKGVEMMLVHEHLFQISKNFFACTQLPIRTVDFHGNILASAGYHQNLEQLFNGNHIFDQVKPLMLAKKEKSMIIIPCLQPVCFAASWMCSKNITRGFHIIGPYAQSETPCLPGISYRPASCIPHLFTLLGDIAADSSYLKQKIKRYSTLPYNTYVKKAIDYLDACYDHPITLTAMASYLNISKYYLCSLFKKATNKTFSQYLNEIRIEKSKELLLKEQLSILDVALAVGFNNQNYYNIMFKKIMHHTPVEFRNRQGSHEQLFLKSKSP